MPKLTRRHAFPILLAIAGCTAAIAGSSVDLAPRPPAVAGVDVAAARAEGPPALDRLLARYDRLAAGAERDALATAIDAVAAQRYATVSRLYWYTELDAAKAAAKATGRPILSLRMLGRLDEDLSCANSRFFRVALYANRELAAFLRQRFILHWSAERAVPRVTIDFGDGRVLARTLTGNSAHYVLDAEGRPIDVLPGLYAPAVFRSELDQDLALVREVAGLAAADRDLAIAAYHQRRLTERGQQWARIAAATGAERRFTAEVMAQTRTVGKGVTELPVLRAVDLGIPVDLAAIPDDANGWAQVGLRLLPGAPAPVVPAAPTAPVAALAKLSPQDVVWRSLDGTGTVFTPVPYQPVLVPQILDDQSRALATRLSPSSWAAHPVPADAETVKRLLGAFERDVLADTAMNEFQLHQQIHARFAAATSREPFAALNAWIYDALFATPASDPWLGLRPSGFLALPGDGILSAR